MTDPDLAPELRRKTWQPYPTYQDTGIEWLGQIPSHWETIRLKFVVDKIGSGKTPQGGANIYQDEGILFIRSQNVHFSGLQLDDVAFISPEIDAEMQNTRVNPEDVLLNITGASLGRCSLVPKYFPLANVNQHVCIIRPNQGIILPDFLHDLLSSNFIQVQISSSEDGISREGLTFSQIGEFILVIPQEVEEQHQIAAFLDHHTALIDDLIAAKQDLIDRLQEERTALISHAVTKGLDPHAPMKDSGIEWLGEIPTHWEGIRLKHLTYQIIDGTHATPTYIDDGVAFLRVTDIHNKEIDFSNVMRISPEEHAELARRCNPKKGDLLLSKNGTIGVPRVITWDEPFRKCFKSQKIAVNCGYGSEKTLPK